MNTYAEGSVPGPPGMLPGWAPGMADPRTEEAKLQDARDAECGGARNARRVDRKEARGRRVKPW